MMEMQLKNSPFYRDGFLMRMKTRISPLWMTRVLILKARGGGDSMLVGYAPGRQADFFPEGVVRKIPLALPFVSNCIIPIKRCLVLALKDRSMVGLVFAKEVKPGTKLMTTNSVRC